tara:strand:+ start:97 stop:1830 length:1734 start_codon:yes stop_codon:yes gene_type:complete
MGVLNDNIVGGAAGVSTGQETYAPSSNDWDYSYHNNIWNAGGNVLGDHTVGGFVNCPTTAGGNYGLRSLFTLDGDFEIAWTHSDNLLLVFGVYAIDEDNVIAGAAGTTELEDMTNSFWYRTESFTDFFIGSTQQSDANTFADGSAVKITRASGTIKVYDDGALVHTYGTTYAGTMRLAFTSDGAGTPEIDDVFITDSEGVQRDGFINEGTGTSRGWGGSSTERHFAFGWKPTRTMTVTSTIVDVQSIGTSFDAKARLYTDNAGSPGSLISASNTVTMSSSGNKTFTFTSGDVNKGTWYWMVFSDEDGGSGSGGLNTIGNYGSLFRSGKASAITSITDHASNGDIKCQIIGETTEEPTPDHNTMLLIHSDTSDASTTFVDSSPNGRTLTANGNVQHDTAQKKFGASSILFDGTGDYLTAVDSPDWNFRYRGHGATIDFWVKTSHSGSQGLMNQNTGDPVNNWDFYQNASHGRLVCLGHSVASGDGSTNVTTTSAINDGNWNHIAYSWDGVTLRVAFNGTWQDSKNFTDPFQDISTVLTIGKAVSVTTAFTGHLDEIRISNVARWDHSANFTPPTSPYP